MKKLFLATSFSGQIDYETGQVKPEFRKDIEEIIEALRKVGGFAVFCAVEHEGWIISNDPPEVGVEKDLAEIDDSDVVLGILHDAVSGGVQYEIGYADGRGKSVFVATREGVDLAYFNQGIANLGRVTHLSYESPELLAAQIKEQASAPQN
jgi:nucleoside 2-deoxyribosyltransferase